MLRPESPLADHRSLLPRRLLPAKAQVAPADKRRNRRSLELNPPAEHAYDFTPKLLISKTTDSLNTECPRKVIHKQDSTDSLKRALLSKDDKKPVIVKQDAKAQVSKQDSTESLKKSLLSRQESNDSVKRKDEHKRLQKQDSNESVKKSEGNKKGLLETDFDEGCKRIYERRSGCARPTLPPVAERAPRSPPAGGPRTPVAAVAEGVVRWGSGLLYAKEEPRLKTATSWYGYGTLPSDSEKLAGHGSGAGGRRALELLLGGGLKSLARPARPVRRAASRDSVLSQPQPLLEGLRKCSTVLALTDREKSLEPIRAHNRLRAPSVCSRCSSLLSLAGVGGSRYSLDGAGGGFVPAAPVNCKLCLEDTPPSKVTIIGGCGCAFCTKCMAAYVEFEVCNGAYEVSCPDARCRAGAALALDEIAALVEPHVMEKHLKFRLNHEVAMDSGRAFCPRVGCDTVVRLRAASPAHCPTCRHDFCSQCNQEWHGGLTCEAAAASSSTAAGSPLLPDSELIKLCPMCRVPIEKDEGCAQMMCKRCKHVFCWYCLASLDDDFLLRHYDKGPCKNKLGHSRASVLWHRAQVVGIFAGFGLLLLVASPLLLLAAPCIVCCKCRLCNPSTKNLEEVDEIESIGPGRDEDDDTTHAPANKMGL
ncbi:hypothetical protein JYU34_020893 [Plutella xylostella]|uniref:RBR-type E3 ubiquitin transferase n=1 Tax=Plutella xylostella TaxID=51655 RepID=A0ABQ7PSF5_PLUXY|nr:hypothetical protein JYU34_020893 [Plutella xylostella]